MKWQEISEDEFQKKWNNMHENDQRFCVAVDLVYRAAHDDTLHYQKLSSQIDKMLQTADRNTLLTITIECLGRLFDAPMLQRFRERHGYQNNGPSGRKGKKKKKKKT